MERGRKGVGAIDMEKNRGNEMGKNKRRGIRERERTRNRARENRMEWRERERRPKRPPPKIYLRNTPSIVTTQTKIKDNRKTQSNSYTLPTLQMGRAKGSQNTVSIIIRTDA